MARRLLILPDKWFGGQEFDDILTGNPPAFSKEVDAVEFQVPKACALRIGVCIRFLSVANQLASVGKKVSINFEETQTGAMTYLDRMGFFDHLDINVGVLPGRPTITARSRFAGMNQGLVEIEPIALNGYDRTLPRRLADTAARMHSNPKVGQQLGDAVFTVFSELVGNVYEHSSTELIGYAALQSYTHSRTVELAVSDSGVGILATLRPALQQRRHPYAHLDDAELLYRVITEGVSRTGDSYGCGLWASATQALAFGAELEIRLPDCRMNFSPIKAGYDKGAVAEGTHQLPHMEGTHICFDFRLDR